MEPETVSFCLPARKDKPINYIMKTTKWLNIN